MTATKAIHKYAVSMGALVPQDVPALPQWLTARWQDSEFGTGLVAWALVDLTGPSERISLLAVPTGAQFDAGLVERARYVGTAEVPGGLIVHVFAVREPF